MNKFWHAHNPHADKAIYVPIERLAECGAGGIILDVHGKEVPFDATFLLNRWNSVVRGGGLDAYVVPQPDGKHLLEVRYGKEPLMRFEVLNQKPELTQQLLEEFRGQ